MKRWLQQTNHDNEWDTWQLQEQRGNVISGLLLHAREQLRELYAADQPVEQMRQQKQLILEGLKAEYATLKIAWNGDSGYDSWFKKSLNNADFIAVATYQQCVPAFEHLLHEADDELPRFYSAVKQLAQHKQAREQLCTTS